MKSTTKRIELNWSKLFGFNQVKTTQAGHKTKSGQAMIGSKIGSKVGSKGG
jgi:hypothetical protein